MEGNGKNALTPRQLKFIPYFLSSRSIEEACRKAHVSKPTVYGWLRDKAFSVEVQKQKDLIYGRAIDSLAAGTDDAVAKLKKLLKSRNETIALRAAHSILTFAIRAKTERAEEHKSENEIFSLNNVMAAWDGDVRSGVIDVTNESKNNGRKVEMKAPLSHKR